MSAGAQDGQAGVIVFAAKLEDVLGQTVDSILAD
jgi:hypothetical protein